MEAIINDPAVQRERMLVVSNMVNVFLPQTVELILAIVMLHLIDFIIDITAD